ncbi:cadherin-related family member 5 [Lampris incognitus]|uniref:cadherin-related family member 5 n=1 Tax=Lampris incognitus TaxID=2546036 RepID=UPI0024B5B622|nr:cadherin-related family member 5 [Lampris incognitus]
MGPITSLMGPITSLMGPITSLMGPITSLMIFPDNAHSSLCLGGSDIFAKVRENSPMGQFVANLSIFGDPGANTIRLCLTGENADWLFLEGRTIRLNASSSRILDREVYGSILMAELTCYEDNVKRSQYRIIVEILNENDNKPLFLEKTIQPFSISELTAVNTVAFTVKATDADGDLITYIIDESLPDANYFRVDLPNSGRVVLDKPLDYETKTQLQLVMHAVESNTGEKYKTSVNLTVNIDDGDDQYPQFLPCVPASRDGIFPVCTNPVYTANITERDQDMVLQFSPGPVHAEDGDRGLVTPLIYTILSGADGKFAIDNQTGEITLTTPVGDRHQTPTFTLHVMASQLNDPMKYSVAMVVVRVLAENAFPPAFNRTIYKGFVTQSTSPATIVTTYGNQVLLIQAMDRDFKNGVNPKMHYSLHPLSVSEGLYRITQDGVLVARTDRLRAFDRHIFQAVARDADSGEVVTASVDIEVLQRGQPAPFTLVHDSMQRLEEISSRTTDKFGDEYEAVRISNLSLTVPSHEKTTEAVREKFPKSPFTEEHLFGDMDTRLAGGVAGIALLFLVVALFLIFQLVRSRRGRRDPDNQGAVALGKHPNVVSSGQPEYLTEEMSYSNEAFIGEYVSSRSGSLHGRHGVYTRKQSLPAALLHPPGRDERGGSRPSGGALHFPVMPEPPPLSRGSASSLQSRDVTSEEAGHSQGPVVKDAPLVGVREESEMETECSPAVKQESHSVQGQTEGTSTDTGDDGGDRV